MKFRKRLNFRRLFNYFLGGLLIILPIFGTSYIIYTAFVFIDSRIDTQSILGFSFPGLGLLIVLAFVTLVGFLAQWIIAKPLLDFFDHILERTPGVKLIYSSLKDFMGAFVGEKRKFREGVAVEMSNGLYKLGFVTTKDLSMIGMEEYVAVYFPHSYNFSGNVFLVPRDKVKPIKGNSSDLMKFIVSGGVTDLDELGKEEQNDEKTV